MDNQVHNSIVSFIWGIADDCLRDVYVRGKYRDVILPMTVIRRLDALLEDSKGAVLEMKKRLDAAKIDNQWPALCNAAGQAFCNASPYRLRDLTSRAKKQTLKADFIAYLDGFSPNVQVILDKFKFRNQIDTMVDADILGAVIEKFVSSDIIGRLPLRGRCVCGFTPAEKSLLICLRKLMSLHPSRRPLRLFLQIPRRTIGRRLPRRQDLRQVY